MSETLVAEIEASSSSPTGIDVIETMVKDPKARPGCDNHPDMEAHYLFLQFTRQAEGSTVRVVSLCSWHVFDQVPEVYSNFLGVSDSLYPEVTTLPLLDLTGGKLSASSDLEPLLNDRAQLADVPAFVEEFLTSSKANQAFLTGVVRYAQRAIAASDVTRPPEL